MATYTNFCCRSGGSNLNAGTRTGNSTEPGTAADLTYASGTFVAATGVFTPASGNPSASGVAVGDFVSIYADGAAETTMIARVTAVSSTTITTGITANTRIGATTDGTSNRTCKVGGAWKGPNGASTWVNLVPGSSMTNIAGNASIINYKNDAVYAITANISLATLDCQYHQGYSSTYGDGGRAIFDGGTSGASYSLLTVSASAPSTYFRDFEFRNNGATGAVAGVTVSGNLLVLENVIVHDMRGAGVSAGGNLAASGCEFYACNTSNTANLGGVTASGGGTFNRCTFRDNVGTNALGLHVAGANSYFVHACTFDTNGSTARGGLYVTSCCTVTDSNFYNNAINGIYNGGYILIAEDCKFFKNGGYGVLNVATTTILRDCVFGSGTMVNTSGATGDSGILSITEAADSVTYAANQTPWLDPANGDFTPSAAGSAGGISRARIMGGC